jgi:hypothetical protein
LVGFPPLLHLVQDGDLLLTTETPEVIRRHLPKATIVSVDDARRAIGLDPVPLGGFPVENSRPANFHGLGFTMPIARGVDGEIVDANDNVVCLVDHNAELSDDRVAAIQNLIVLALNRYEGENAL